MSDFEWGPADQQCFSLTKIRRLLLLSVIESEEKKTDKAFDIILVDGEARKACLLYSVPKLKIICNN